jgi:hypothetical protein
MENLKDITYPDLIDQLAEHTSRYVKMIAGNLSTEEFEKTKQMIEAIIKEIKNRPAAEVKDHETESNHK